MDVGAVIGRGGFCEVQFLDLLRPSRYGIGSHDRGVERQTYAMKYLSPAKSASSRVFQRGLANLATKACFLSLLRHKHVICLHYVGEGSLEENYGCDDSQNRVYEEVVTDAHGNLQLRRRSPEKPRRSDERLFGYFLLLVPLQETLTDRIETSYVSQELLCHSENEGGDEGRESCVSRLQLAERLDVLISAFSALQYLHEECSVCQCHDEIVKLFDFGLAKELKPKDLRTHPRFHDESTYRLMACTGSRRYMAPEVCFGDPYNEKADMYSFGMLAYQTCSLVAPFDGWDAERHKREALRGGGGPHVSIPGRVGGQGTNDGGGGGAGKDDSKVAIAQNDLTE
ncbi:hypothetical protein ACHAWF_001269, partial [Thalassiosira exigua]